MNNMNNLIKFNPYELNFYYKKSEDPKTDFYASHIHNDYEMLYFYDGDADYIIGGAIYHLQKNDLLFIQPAVYHYIRILSSRPYERLVFSFHESVVHEDLRPFLPKADNFYHIEKDSVIRRLIDNLRDCNTSFSKKEYEYFGQTTLNQIILNLKYSVSHTVRERLNSHSDLEDILLYIDENPTLPLNISHLAEKFNCSPSWIAHSFKKYLNISPSQYINRKKIAYAQSLINMGMPPVQVAEMCSYINYTTFYRQYKKYLKLTPAQDRKN